MTTPVKTRQEIAREYGISTKTLSRWIKKHGIPAYKRDLITPLILSEIYLKLGCPMESVADQTSPNKSDTSMGKKD